ncbi:hypothetical protein PC129_g3987 [Phytophthora cactorum]|uniref:Uncharacterized protein n=1 Tax=Phytophthora cactorum TaxID=29920 RepID=A0A8T1IKX1_9STRA|nr:hypothetical protein PC114_g5841 [Phytophthora cactorum]KAG2935704.1 hypothetical protein PC115_g4811 [Phytophthora cactorum]KAG2949286.1 hypothetical protein PC117_g5367 [Phytophthora cactorum]KAG3097038.1 hypothetical protein PC122_g4716 [Phytophthora cactorum]KAG3182449.1 hypothetical protein C6341_g5940 [Phytophthora cactorum]
MPAAVASDAGLGSKEDDARLNERISKARSELSELHKIMAKDDRDRQFRESNGPASRTRSRTTGSGSNTQQDVKRPPPLDVGYQTSQPLRSASGERLMQLSRTDEAVRSDRMKMAELSDEQHMWKTTEKETAAPRSDRGRMSPVNRQALNFDNVTDDDDDDAVSPTRPKSGSMRRLGEDVERDFDQEHAGEYGGVRTQQDLHTYVRQMEETIAQLVQQKDELLRNQAEFDKQASGIFPSLENLNHQLSQIVQGKLLQSGQSRNNDDVANLHEDMLDELRVQREQLSELEADSKRRKYDAELQEQDRAIEISQIKADIISVVASEKMRDERSELMADTLKKLQQELQEAVKNMVQRYQLLDKRINQLQTPMTQPRLVGRKSQRNTLFIIIAVLLGFFSVVLGSLFMNSGDCGVVERCHPLI